MKIQLLSCNAQRPNARAIAKMLEEIAQDIDGYSARESTDILLNGTPIEIEVADKTTGSAFRAIRKLEIDYEIME
ncbi:MAG: hypothetical protein AAGG68_30595 [Bacteroidota bacterium]